MQLVLTLTDDNIDDNTMQLAWKRALEVCSVLELIGLSKSATIVSKQPLSEFTKYFQNSFLNFDIPYI